jgi:catechol 2,3-dioxygenase-like lactoylglutathione lyase family enzyme
VDFYVTKLGLPVAFDLQIPENLAVPSGLAPSGFRHVRVRAGGTLIKLMEIDPAPAAPDNGFRAGVRWLTFRVTDIASTVATLQARGVAFLSSPLQGLTGSFVCAQAPDGVILEFVELYSPTDDRP